MGSPQALLATLLVSFYPIWAVDICGDYPRPDPCLPGGEWDPSLKSCTGYGGLSCFQCYSGPLCKTWEDPVTCQLYSTGGNPLVIAQYWLNSSAHEPCSTTLAHYRPAYQRGPGELLPPLRDAILKLHAVTGNAETEGRQLVGGFGATMMLHATISALSQMILDNCISNCPPVVDVLVQPPYYENYPYVVDLVKTAQWNTTADPDSPYTIEILTYPNNPNGIRRSPLVMNQHHVIRDMVYYWPMYTDTNLTVSEPIMIFSSSKHGGIAGTRFGWGLYEDSTLAMNVVTVIDTLVLGLSIDVELRVLASLQAILEEKLGPSGLLPFHEAGRTAMLSRFTQLSHVMTCAVLTNYPSSSPGAYAWVQCKDGENCVDFFKKVNLIVESGTLFGSSHQYARMSMLLPTVEFEVLVKKIMALCS